MGQMSHLEHKLQEVDFEKWGLWSLTFNFNDQSLAGEI